MTEATLHAGAPVWYRKPLNGRPDYYRRYPATFVRRMTEARVILDLLAPDGTVLRRIGYVLRENVEPRAGRAS